MKYENYVRYWGLIYIKSQNSIMVLKFLKQICLFFGYANKNAVKHRKLLLFLNFIQTLIKIGYQAT